MVERSELDRTLAALLSGWSSLLVPLLLVFFILGLWGLFAARRLRSSEHASPMPWPLLVLVYGEVLLLKIWDGPWPTVAVLSVALVVAGGMARVDRTGLLLLPAVLLGALLGTGQLISAVLFAAAGLLVFIIAPART